MIQNETKQTKKPTEEKKRRTACCATKWLVEAYSYIDMSIYSISIPDIQAKDALLALLQCCSRLAQFNRTLFDWSQQQKKINEFQLNSLWAFRIWKAYLNMICVFRTAKPIQGEMCGRDRNYDSLLRTNDMTNPCQIDQIIYTKLSTFFVPFRRCL